MTVFVAEHHEHEVKYIVLLLDKNTFASISDDAIMYVCNLETGHYISGLFKLRSLDFIDWWD